MIFNFKHFSLLHDKSTLKIGTDSVLLGSAIPLGKETTILDIGCGCGVILFCLAYRFQKINSENQDFTGLDIDESSIIEATENASNFPNSAKQKISFAHISLQNFANFFSPFDLIVSNPPFFSNSLSSPYSKNQRSKHADGNLSLTELATNVKKILAAEGTFFLILPPTEMRQFKTIAKDISLFEIFEMEIYPIEGKNANRMICGFAHVPKAIIKKKLTIRDSEQNYHIDYKNLTKDFYLNF